MESQTVHLTRLNHIVSAITSLALPDGEPDQSEALWYEPWDLILNWLRSQTSFDLTIGPQYRLVNVYLLDDESDPVNEDWSMVANQSELDIILDNDNESVRSQVDFSQKRMAQIPDFVALLYAPSIIKRKIPLIVEIKPGSEGPLRYQLARISRTVVQTLLQARFAFEAYNENQTIHILCVAGLYWSMYSVNRRDLKYFPTKWDYSRNREVETFVDGIVEGLNVFHLLNETKDQYSEAFKRAWNGFATANGLPQAAFS